MHYLQALKAIVTREFLKFVRQYGRLASAIVRPLLWLAVFAAGFRSVFGVSIIEPYSTYVPYDVYIMPGLIGMVLLFNGMQSSLAMVYDREMGLMRLLLTAPLPRWWILACKLCATAALSMFQAIVFIGVAVLLGYCVVFSGAALQCLDAGCLGTLAQRVYQAVGKLCRDHELCDFPHVLYLHCVVPAMEAGRVRLRLGLPGSAL
jgi:ABC-2 type transport system permease protein